jgi:Thioredoxin
MQIAPPLALTVNASSAAMNRRFLIHSGVRRWVPARHAHDGVEKGAAQDSLLPTLLSRRASYYNYNTGTGLCHQASYNSFSEGGPVNRIWWRAAFLAIGVALLASALIGQAKLSPADLTAAKTLGSPQAPITLEIFSDYQCPDCKRMHLETTRQVIDNYVSSGKVRLVHRDFPLSMHSHSKEAAHWLNAAAAAGVFEPAEVALYTKQDDWGATGKVQEALAGTIESTQGAQLDAAVASDMALGNSRNVNGTPSIFVLHRGQLTPFPSGGVDYTLLKQYLDYLLQH